MIPSIIKVPVSLAQQLAVGAVRAGVSGGTALLRCALPGHHADAETRSPSEPTASSPSAPAKKAAPAKPAPAKPAPTKKAAPTKPAATLDEPIAPTVEDPVVYSSGPEVAASLPAEDLEAMRSEL